MYVEYPLVPAPPIRIPAKAKMSGMHHYSISAEQIMAWTMKFETSVPPACAGVEIHPT